MSLHELILTHPGYRRGPPPPAHVIGREPHRLIAHILERYHKVHRRELPQAIALARTVEAVHAGDPGCPAGLADFLSIMADELEGHQQKEEKVLFPMILAGGSPMIRFPIDRMMAEHVEVEQQLMQLAALTDRFTPPDGACPKWRELCALCAKIADDLGEHMRIENELLFAPFRAGAPPKGDAA